MENKKLRLPFRISDSDVPEIIHFCRRMSGAEIQIIITFPESPSQGGWRTRPYSRGGPDVLVDITVPIHHDAKLQEMISTISGSFQESTPHGG